MTGPTASERALAQLLAAFGAGALTRAEVGRMELPEGVTAAVAWRMGAVLRYARHVDLPFGQTLPDGASRSWFFHTQRLDALLQSCLMTGTNNPHVTTTLQLPEGRHVRTDLLMRDCRAALSDMGARVAPDRFARVVLEVDAPATDAERLALRAFGLMDAAHVRDEPAVTADAALAWHDELLAPADARHGDREASRAAIQAILAGTATMNVFVRAVVCQLACMEARPFATGNALVGSLLATRVLREGGMAFMAWLPLLDFLVRWRRGEPTAPAYQPRRAPEACVVPTGGTLDWTGFLEETLRFCADEAWWLSNKLTRMARRRARLTRLFQGDAAHNERQRETLVEAYVHDDAEFTFAGMARRHGVAYSTAHDDLAALADEGFLTTRKVGRALFFVAVPDAQARIRAWLRAVDPRAYDACFDADGRLVGVRVIPWDEARATRPATTISDVSECVHAALPRVARDRQLVIEKGRRHQAAEGTDDACDDATTPTA
ncbi:hypothetical protein I3I95_02030 [bacterium]|nr:hypothetical protein [bacterium]